MKVAITNLGQIVTGNWREPFASGDTIILDSERIASVGNASADAVSKADVVIDADGMTAIPGLIDSHVHITFGDYTPRQRTVGYLESYLHGGTTTAISASEVHVPGRPRDVEGVKALAVAAQRCFAEYRPGGMRVIAGSVILEPGLQAADFRELVQKGVRLAKAGFGAVKSSYDYVPLVADAKAAGLITTCHTGGSSIPGSGAITGDHLLKMHPHVSFHITGGPTAMPDADFERVIKESTIALQVCTAGNLRTTLLCARLADANGAFERFIIATDTPTNRPAAGALHLRRHRQQRKSLWLRQRVARARQSSRSGADRRAGWRHTKDRARRHQAWRHRRNRRGGDRRRAALCWPQSQYAGNHPQGTGCIFARDARLRRGDALGTGEAWVRREPARPR